MARIEFPRDFVFGSATAAHQVEGNNIHNDWWAHENSPDTNAVEPSGIACDHYHRFREDFQLLRELGHPAHRLSLEWSRIEPAPGEIDRGALEHYRRVLGTLRDYNIEPWVTIHHFTSPLWFIARGGFTEERNLDALVRHTELLAREYGDLVSHWCTINEPNVVAEMGYRFGYFPPRLLDADLAAQVLTNFFRAHARMAEVLHAHARSKVEIGITLAVQAHEPLRLESEADRALAARRDAETNGVMFEALRTGVFAYPGREPVAIPGLREASTFVGVQYYSRVRYDGESQGPAMPDFNRILSHMGWEVYPEGFGPLLERAAATGLPVVVTENGLAHDDDRVRIRYIADHLAQVDQARRRGADVRGYFYWSAMDNFEWNFGYGPKFGLIEVDRQTLERRPRRSAFFFREVIQQRGFDEDTVERWCR
ncbi:MAG: glycoside hydrolase family 1 protein [Candidatus Binatia bacterium]|nr:glycoside hydrolase family 1 protein [Candidatus Binatia bacterium]